MIYNSCILIAAQNRHTPIIELLIHNPQKVLSLESMLNTALYNAYSNDQIVLIDHILKNYFIKENRIISTLQLDLHKKEHRDCKNLLIEYLYKQIHT